MRSPELLKHDVQGLAYRAPDVSLDALIGVHGVYDHQGARADGMRARACNPSATARLVHVSAVSLFRIVKHLL